MITFIPLNGHHCGASYLEEQGMTDATYPDLMEKTVLVTGGGSGIGEAIVMAFAQQGARVGFIDIDSKASARVVEKATALGGTVHFEHADLRDVAALRKAIDGVRSALGPITVLMNNAANDDRHDSEKVTPEYFDDRIAVNLKHQFFAAQAVLTDMKSAGGGSIVNFGSHSWMLGMGGMVLYTACKSAVLGLTRSLARDYGGYNIRVNSLAPGWTMTERQLTHWVNPEGEKMLNERQCLKRKLYPDEIARVALFLGSQASSAITSQSLVADGGWA